MTIILTLEKKIKNSKPLPRNHREDVVKIKFLSNPIGNLVAAFSVVTLEPFYYRALENDMKKALQQAHGKCDASVTLSKDAKKELCWWITNIVPNL